MPLELLPSTQHCDGLIIAEHAENDGIILGASSIAQIGSNVEGIGRDPLPEELLRIVFIYARDWSQGGKYDLIYTYLQDRIDLLG